MAIFGHRADGKDSSAILSDLLSGRPQQTGFRDASTPGSLHIPVNSAVDHS